MANVKTGTKILEGGRQSFGKDVSILRRGRDVTNTNIASSDAFPYEVQVNLHMLGPLMLHEISGEIDGTYIITVDQRSGTNGRMKLHQQLPQPGYSSNSISYRRILSFYTRTRDRGLALRGPGNKILPKEHSITRCRSTRVWAAGPVGISVSSYSVS
jgi:hypothetical protein